MNFVKKSLKYPQVTLSVLALTFLVGVYSLMEMPRREDARIRIRVGQVIALYPGANALQVEEQVTRKLEQHLFQYAEVRKEKTTSVTSDGMVVITVWLNNDVRNFDSFWSKLNHQLNVLKALSLPQGVYGPIVNSEFGDTEALIIAVEMEQPQYAQLREYAQKLEDTLRTMKEVSKIKRIGEQKEQIVVFTDSAKLALYGVRLDQVMKILQSQNRIGPAGDLKTSDVRVPLYTQGYYQTEAQIGDQIVGFAKTGEVVRLRDVARIERRYEEPSSKIIVNGKSSLLLAVQTHEGYNIVAFGKAMDRKLAEASRWLPAGVQLTTIVNQPKIVERNVGHFLFEFVLAITAVILVILLLLPLRVAAVAATAIPMTVAMTFALLHFFGIELHQVSLSALIVVLGMVVDDAVVVADNYVELLDNGVRPTTAAWKSATELVVPILTATLTIIAAFLPMVMLSGMVKDFIIALPLTVSIALAASFIVAMVLTPVLCLAFVQKGLRDPAGEAAGQPPRGSVLRLMQSGYDRAIVWSMAHSRLTILVCLGAMGMAVVLYQIIPQKFFPEAERNQLIVDLWMPTGTKLEKTEHAIGGIQDLIQRDPGVVSYATFVGSGIPRFYYNFVQGNPAANFAQILVNTHRDDDASRMCRELNRRADEVVPEGKVQARLLQQGVPADASVEIRIIGDDIAALKEVAKRVEDILRQTRAIAFLRLDSREDHYGVAVRLKDGAERLGFTTESVAKSIYAGFTGAPVSTLYEGNVAVDIVLRLDERSRRHFGDVENLYLTSPVTGAGVPLRQIAFLEPQWQTGRINHLNGLRTLTVQCEPADGYLASQVLKMIGPQIAGLSLPTGFRIEYGGEYENQKETFSEMLKALAVSLLMIFLILLFQFRNLKETLIVMLTIPLSMFGAMLGLLMTGNPFGFTAFVGLISLSGIVARNAIILLDHADELCRGGASVATAALESGKRRLRPIFLTASAAAIGVIPMILSGSPLWSPMASVIAVGIMLSMVTSLFLVPVLYALLMKPAGQEQKTPAGPQADGIAGAGEKLMLLALAFVCLLSSPSGAQERPEALNLQKVTELALQNNRLLTIKQLQVQEKQQKVNEDRVKYFPAVIVGGSYQYNNNIGSVTLQQGALGQATIGTTSIPIPSADTTLKMGQADTYTAGVLMYQPISQIPKIMAGVNVSKTDLEIAKTDQTRATLQVKQTAEKLYFGLLIQEKRKEEAQIRLELARKKLYDVESAVLAGKTTPSSLTGLRANVADEEQNLLKTNVQMEDYFDDLRRLTGLKSASFALAPVPVDDSDFSIAPAGVSGRQENQDLKIAALYQTKAQHAVDAGRYSYLPSFGILGGYVYQDGSTGLSGSMPNPLISGDIGLDPRWTVRDAFIGVVLNWNLQDLVANTYVTRQRLFLKKQAEENLANTREQVHADTEKARRKLMHAAELIGVAEKVVEYRREDFKIQTDRFSAGLSLDADRLAAKAALAKAEADLLAARLNYRMAQTDLQILTGRY